MPRLLVLALLLLACGQEGEFLCPECGTDDTDGPGGDTSSADNDTGGATDTGDASDSGTDNDTGSDSADTGGADPRDGTYRGTLALDATTGDGTTDRCEGTFEAAVGAAGEPDVQGTAACSFAGALAADFPTGLAFVIEGSLRAEPAVEGTLTSGTDALPFTGNLADGAFTGTFSGTLHLSPELQVAGSFSASR